MKNINKVFSLLLAILIISFSGCEGDKQKLQSDAQTLIEANNYQIVIDESKFNSTVTDEYSLLNAYLKNDSLKIDVQYGGGCGLAKFELITDGLYIKTNPVKLKMLLSFIDEDDCEATIVKRISFGLSSLARHYKELFQKSYGTIVVHLQNHNGDLIYTF